jgi:hypothetical protein
MLHLASQDIGSNLRSSGALVHNIKTGRYELCRKWHSLEPHVGLANWRGCRNLFWTGSGRLKRPIAGSVFGTYVK